MLIIEQNMWLYQTYSFMTFGSRENLWRIKKCFLACPNKIPLIHIIFYVLFISAILHIKLLFKVKHVTESTSIESW